MNAFVIWLPRHRQRCGPCSLCEKRREGGVRLLTWVRSIAIVLHLSSTCVVVDCALLVAMSPASCENKAMGKGRVTYLDG